MKSPSTGLLVLVLAAYAMVADSAAGRTVATSVDVPVTAGLEVAIRLRAGDVVVVGGGEPGTLNVSVTWSCGDAERSRCEALAAGLGLSTAASANRVTLGVIGVPTFTTTGLRSALHVVVPPGHPVEIDVGAGNVRFEGFLGPIEVDLGAGNVEGELDLATTSRVDLASRAGRATLRLPTGDIVGSGLVGSALVWTREGGGIPVEVDVGAGEVVVSLRATPNGSD